MTILPTFAAAGMKYILIIFVLTYSPLLTVSFSQTEIQVKGKVYDENGYPLPNSIVLNQRTKRGSFGNPNGDFNVLCWVNDTITITALGYHSRTFTVPDAGPENIFRRDVYLDLRIYEMPVVEIFGPRDLEAIQEDIERLGYNEKDYLLSGINAAASPITFLYQQFSKKEQSKREAAYLANEDRKRDLLKELFRHYVDYEIIQLDNSQFDDFIDYLNVSDEFMRRSTQYDFLIYVRDRFKEYKVKLRQLNKMKASDFDYDKD